MEGSAQGPFAYEDLYQNPNFYQSLTLPASETCSLMAPIPEEVTHTSPNMEDIAKLQGAMDHSILRIIDGLLDKSAADGSQDVERDMQVDSENAFNQSEPLPDGMPGIDVSKSALQEHVQMSYVVRQRPLFQRLWKAHFMCRKMATTDGGALNEEVRGPPPVKVEEGRHAAAKIPVSMNVNVNVQEIDAMLSEYLKAVEKLRENLEEPYARAHNVMKRLKTDLADLELLFSKSVSPVEEDIIPPLNRDRGGMNANHPIYRSNEKREYLKRTRADEIMAINETFVNAKKSKKLPDRAVGVLKGWWRAHLKWPYPTDREKSDLSARSGLDDTQIANWFINQRKRHWHKFFKSQPQSADEASDMIRNHNLMGKLKDSCR